VRLNDPPNGVELDAVKSYDSKVKRSVTCWGWGWPRERSESLSVTEAVPLWSWDHKLAMPSMARLGTLRPEEANRAFSDFN
jgi:hypothetical protein